MMGPEGASAHHLLNCVRACPESYGLESADSGGPVLTVVGVLEIR